MFADVSVLPGKAGGFLALDWNDSSHVGALARTSYALHQQLAQQLPGTGYRPVNTLQVGGEQCQADNEGVRAGCSSLVLVVLVVAGCSRLQVHCLQGVGSRLSPTGGRHHCASQHTSNHHQCTSMPKHRVAPPCDDYCCPWCRWWAAPSHWHQARGSSWRQHCPLGWMDTLQPAAAWAAPPPQHR